MLTDNLISAKDDVGFPGSSVSVGPYPFGDYNLGEYNKQCNVFRNVQAKFNPGDSAADGILWSENEADTKRTRKAISFILSSSPSMVLFINLKSE